MIEPVPERRYSCFHLVPNGLTILRAALGIVFPWLPSEWYLAIILVAGGTDLLDGELSRRLHCDGRTGKYLDPLADKIFLLGVVVTLILRDWISVGEMLLIAIRDIVVILGVAWLTWKGRTSVLRHLRPTLLGKLTTVFQILVFVGIILEQHTRPLAIGSVALISLAAGTDYVRRACAIPSSNEPIDAPMIHP